MLIAGKPDFFREPLGWVSRSIIQLHFPGRDPPVVSQVMLGRTWHVMIGFAMGSAVVIRALFPALAKPLVEAVRPVNAAMAATPLTITTGPQAAGYQANGRSRFNDGNC